MTKRPEVVVFDLGKVLVDFDYGIAARRIAAKGRLSPAQLKQLIDHSPLLFRYETGAIDTLQFHREICQQAGYSGTLPEFERDFSDIFTAIDAMVALHAELRRQNVPTFILSNTNDLAVGHIRRTFPFFSNFDGYILSYEQGVMKPDPRIYEIAETITQRRADQLVYIDDRLDNIEGARERGWQIVHHQSFERTLGALQKMDLLTGWSHR